MPKKTEDLQKHTLNLRRGDYERLQGLYPEIGAGAVIRRIVSNFLDRDSSGVDSKNVEVSV